MEEKNEEIKKDNAMGDEKPVKSGGQDAAEKTVSSAEYNELKERFLRLAAEFDNYKKRTAADISNAKELGVAEFIRSMLYIIDEFDIALNSASKSSDRNLVKGIELLYTNFIDTLKSNGLKEIDTSGKFDPYKHEIIMTKKSNSKDGHIIEVIKKGYMFKDKLLRVASVIVSKNDAEDESASEKENSAKNDKNENNKNDTNKQK